MSLLQRPVPLGDVRDIERFCRTLLNDISEHLEWSEYDHWLADLIGISWEIHERWDVERTPSFQQYLAWKLREHAIPSLIRAHRGRTSWKWSDSGYERERPAVLSLDAGERVLGESDAVRSILPTADSLAHLRARTVRERSRFRARDRRILRQALLDQAA
jgi:hypothetical protein